MKHGLLVANIGSYADVRTTVAQAQAAERSGWDAFLVWDHLAFAWGRPAADPWITLAAVAMSTERIAIGTGVTPVPRRRPHVLAHQIATLDRLSGGRVIFGAGLGGGHGEFRKFGENEEERPRAELLDEGLDVIRALLAGGVVHHHGDHFTVDGVQLNPAPEGDVPIWIGGMSKRARARAERFDCWFADTSTKDEMNTTPEELARLLEGYDFGDVAVMGFSEPGDRELRASYADAGATWWIEQVQDARADVATMRRRIEAGPG